MDRPEWWASWVDDYLPTERISLDPKLEMLFLKCRDLACNYIEQKIVNWLIINKIRDFKVNFEEYSNSNPVIVIKLPYKDDYDTFYVTFNRNNWYQYVQYWKPTRYQYHTYGTKVHKKNLGIVQKLSEYLSVSDIEKTINYPFKCPHKSLS